MPSEPIDRSFLVEPVFEARSAGFRYPDGTRALQDITFTIRSGERIALLGANGSGKSTLLHLLGALNYAQDGEILAFGQPLTQKYMEGRDASLAFRRRVQFVFQDADVQLFSPTVEEELAFGPLQLDHTADAVRNAVDVALENAGIPHLKHRPPYRLSGGEKRKVALASVLILQPDVLLLDEPAAGLDPRSVGALIDILTEFHEGGGTIVMATHDLPLLEELADRALVFGEDHTLHADLPVREVLNNQDLLKQHNLVHAHRHRHGDQEHLHIHAHGESEHQHGIDPGTA